VTGTWALRPLVEDDRDLIRTATLANMNWTGQERFTDRDLDTSPGLRHYCVLDPSRGDFGFVAERDGRSLGVVWLLFLDSRDPGYGFVADGVPELSVTVRSGHRGRGIGRSLVTRALDGAGARGLPRVGLSVETGNPALALYRSLGFEQVVGRPEGTLALDLPP
jgi:ribosomal protein S18 acetylase RimI-like enzyme